LVAQRRGKVAAQSCDLGGRRRGGVSLRAAIRAGQSGGWQKRNERRNEHCLTHEILPEPENSFSFLRPNRSATRLNRWYPRSSTITDKLKSFGRQSQGIPGFSLRASEGLGPGHKFVSARFR